MTLYDISQSYLDFMAAVEAGEIPEDAIDDTLEAIEGALEVKADNIACLIKSEMAAADAIKYEMDTLAQRMKSKKVHADRLRDYLFRELSKADMRKIETARNRISIAKKPASVQVLDEAKAWAWLDENEHGDCLKVERSLRKSEIAKLLKDGVQVPGLDLVAGERLDIK